MHGFPIKLFLNVDTENLPYRCTLTLLFRMINKCLFKVVNNIRLVFVNNFMYIIFVFLFNVNLFFYGVGHDLF